MAAMALLGSVCSVAAVSEIGPLPTGARAPTVIPAKPTPFWSWDRIPTSMHGADKNREYNDSEVARLAKYQMYTPEKWYTPGGAQGPTQSGPSCAIESKTEELFRQIRAINPNQTTILYWNSMFDFSFYTAHQKMLDLEAAGTHAFLRDETGEIISLCNDGNVYCNITTFDWTEPAVRALWVETVINATKKKDRHGKPLVDGIFADHSGHWGNGINIGSAHKDAMGPNQLCNGAGKGRLCYNFTTEFKESFNSWHNWATNYTQDLLSKTTGGPVIQGPYSRMNTMNACDFDAVRAEQKDGFNNSDGVLQRLTVVEARATGGPDGPAQERRGGTCKPDESCLAAYLAAAEPYTYLHCMGNGDDLLGDTVFPEMDYPLGAPAGKAVEFKKGVWVRKFGKAKQPTVVTWDNNAKTGKIDWAHLRGKA